MQLLPPHRLAWRETRAAGVRAIGIHPMTTLSSALRPNLTGARIFCRAVALSARQSMRDGVAWLHNDAPDYPAPATWSRRCVIPADLRAARPELGRRGDIQPRVADARQPFVAILEDDKVAGLFSAGDARCDAGVPGCHDSMGLPANLDEDASGDA